MSRPTNQSSDLQSGETPAVGIGRGSGGCTIRQLRKEMNAALDRMGITRHTDARDGHGAAWHGKFLRDKREAEA